MTKIQKHVKFKKQVLLRCVQYDIYMKLKNKRIKYTYKPY